VELLGYGVRDPRFLIKRVEYRDRFAERLFGNSRQEHPFLLEDNEISLTVLMRFRFYLRTRELAQCTLDHFTTVNELTYERIGACFFIKTIRFADRASEQDDQTHKERYPYSPHAGHDRYVHSKEQNYEPERDQQ
jgi:hypothetical protein